MTAELPRGNIPGPPWFLHIHVVLNKIQMCIDLLITTVTEGFTDAHGTAPKLTQILKADKENLLGKLRDKMVETLGALQ